MTKKGQKFGLKMGNFGVENCKFLG